MPASLSKKLDERRNVRPYVLILCFIWGLACGFGFYILRTPATVVTDDKPKPKAKAKKKEEVKLTQTNESVFRNEDWEAKKLRPPAKTSDEMKKIPAVTAISHTKMPKLSDAPPSPAPVSINPLWGLTSETAKKPAMPVKPVSKPSNPAATGSSATTGGSIPGIGIPSGKGRKPLLENMELPELDE